MRCKHEPKPLYQINRKSLAAVILAPHRASDWQVCDVCGQVGLRSRNTRRIPQLDAQTGPSGERQEVERLGADAGLGKKGPS